jgi:pimeloyl-ACP methyl ester carboxylesterase
VATFVLVHGMWAGGWYWQKVRPLLRAAGHEVFSPTLTGLGERVHLARPEVDLDTHIDDVVNVMRYEDLRDVVLVGHSYAGMVIGGVADRAPERLARLVYLDAFVPEDGDCVEDFL